MRIRGEAPTDYIDKLTDTSDAAAPVWYESVSIIKMFGSEASNAIPHLIRALGTTNNLNNWLIQAHACEALGSIRSQPEVCVPALIQPLQSADVSVRQAALRSLLQFGRDAQSARIALVECLHDPDPWIRTNTARLLEQIDPGKSATGRED
jgi:HEAT repeat protein